MRSVSLDLVFSLKMDKKNPGVLKLNRESGNRNYLPLSDFLELLPLHFNKSGNLNYNSNNLSGEKWQDRGMFGFVSETKADPMVYLKHLSYKHYTNLERDLKQINPNYHFTKKNGLTLDHFLSYYKEAIEGMNVKEVVSKVSRMNDVIPLDIFAKNFHCINKENSAYIIPHFNFENVTPLYELFKENVDPFPFYSLTNSSKEMILSYIDEVFYIVKNDGKIDYATFSKNEKKELMDEIENFFPYVEREKNFYYDPNVISVDSIFSRNWSKTIQTTAMNVFKFNRLQDEFSKFRSFFSDHYKIKARGKDQLWEKALEKIAETKPSFDYPFFKDMSQNSIPAINVERNQSIIELFKSGSENEKKDMFIKLILMEISNFIEDKSEVSKYYGKVTEKSLNAFIMPDYGEKAKLSPSFDEILANK